MAHETEKNNSVGLTSKEIDALQNLLEHPEVKEMISKNKGIKDSKEKQS